MSFALDTLKVFIILLKHILLKVLVESLKCMYIK